MKSIKELIKNVNDDGSDDNLNLLIATILGSKFYVARYLEEDGSFLMIEDHEGNLHYPIFSDLEELDKWEGDFDADIWTFRQYLCHIMDEYQGNNVVINPFGESFDLPEGFINDCIEAIRLEEKNDHHN